MDSPLSNGSLAVEYDVDAQMQKKKKKEMSKSRVLVETDRKCSLMLALGRTMLILCSPSEFFLSSLSLPPHHISAFSHSPVVLCNNASVAFNCTLIDLFLYVRSHTKVYCVDRLFLDGCKKKNIIFSKKKKGTR